MNKKIKIVLIVIVLAVAGFFGARYYAYHGGKRDIQSEKAAFTLTSTEILKDYTTNQEAASKKYLNKPVKVSGVVTEAKDSIVTLDSNISCKFTAINKEVKVGQKATIKGRIVGFDDLFGELKLDQCNLAK
jgi:hypothetical protein